MLWIAFERFEFAFECLLFCSNGANLHSNASNPFLMVKIYIGMDQSLFEWSNLHSNASNLDPNALIPFRMVVFECFECLSTGSNLHLNP